MIAGEQSMIMGVHVGPGEGVYPDGLGPGHLERGVRRRGQSSGAIGCSIPVDSRISPFVLPAWMTAGASWK
jgi:hypothetical protein